MLSDAHIDAADRAVTQIFETTSMAWRTIPHWFTGDPGRGFIRNDGWYEFENHLGGNPTLPDPPDPALDLGRGPYGGDPVAIDGDPERVNVTLAEATAANPDQVVSAASAMAVEVVKKFDLDVAAKLAEPALTLVKPGTYPLGTARYHAVVDIIEFGATPTNPQVPSAELLGARSTVEEAGYYGSRCVWAGPSYFNAFHRVSSTRLIMPACASLLQMSSIYRWVPETPADTLDALDQGGLAIQQKAISDTMIVIGRRQEIAPGRAFDAAPGPEPIDLAVSVAPSIEIIGDAPNGEINLAVRIRYALRFKDNRAVVAWRTTG